MDPKFLSFVIKTLLLKPQSRTYMAPPPSAGCALVPQSTDCELDEETCTAMRELIAKRLSFSVEAIASALVELIKRNSQMPMTDALCELCDEAPETYRFALTQQVTLVNPNLLNALASLLTPCNYPATIPPTEDQSKNALVNTINYLSGYHANIKMGIEALTQIILSPNTYSPAQIIRESNSKVMILHDSPYKDKIREIADEKYMVVLTDTSMRSDPMTPSYTCFRPELELLLLINAYNSPNVDNDILFPKDDHARHLWAGTTDYLAMEQYINNTEGIRDELASKAPEFLKDFDEDLAALRKASK